MTPADRPQAGGPEATEGSRHGLGVPDVTHLLAAIVDSSDEAILSKNIDGVITSWNGGAERLFGYTAVEAIGKSIALIVPHSEEDELASILAKVEAGVRVGPIETKRRRKDGRTVDVSVTISPVRDRSEKIIGASAVAHDISDRKRNEASRSLLAAIVASSDDAIVSADLNGVITSWNAGAERIYGYTAAEVVGTEFALSTAPGSAAQAPRLAGGARGQVAVQHLESRRTRKDGTAVQVAMTIFPIRDGAGAVVGGSAIVREISELNAARDALIASEVEAREARVKARASEEIIAAKDEVVSLLSHELRTPLASIVGFTELLASRELSDAQRKVYLGVMLREGRRLTDLVNDVLQMQRLENGHQSLNLAPVDLRSLIQRAVESAGDDERRPIGMILPEPLPLVLADTDAILQVLGNFLSNARKFSPVGGSIRVGARHEGDMVEIYVRDQGLGVPADAVPKMFQKFYRVDSADRRLIKGSGLGLSINQKIVESHGGTVGVQSDGPGKGSRFHFTLPVAKESAKTGDVLIIEDDAGFARMLEAEFAAQGLSSVRASDAETAEQLLAHQYLRAVVLDLRLPGLQGEDFLARLRSGKNAKLPVVVLTVKNLSGAEIMSLQRIGVTAVLPKEAGAPQAAVTLIAESLAPSAPVAR